MEEPPVDTRADRRHDGSGRTIAATLALLFLATLVLAIPISAQTFVQPSDDIQALVNAAGVGTTFVLGAGVYRLQSVVPKNGQTFVGEPGAILSGAKLLTRFARSGSAWIATGQTQQGKVSGALVNGVCRASAPRCGYPEDLFVDDVPLQHVASLADGGPGRWFFDYSTDQIYLWDDPAGKRVETSVTARAFGGTATGVILRGLVVEKYAAPTEAAAIILGPGWRLEASEVRWNHFAGVATGPASTTLDSHVHHNGAFGFIGGGHGILVENNEIDHNNYAGYDSYWGAGGSKWVYTDGLVVRGNYSHHNDGPGLWTDINNINTLYENNTVEDNQRGGILHELSYAAIIRNNALRRNGAAREFAGWTTGAGIEIVDSSNVQVYGNTLVDNWQGITALDDGRADPNVQDHGEWRLTNLDVHDNVGADLRVVVVAGAARRAY